MSRGEGGDKMVFKCPDGTFRRIGPVVIGRGKLDSRGGGEGTEKLPELTRRFVVGHELRDGMPVLGEKTERTSERSDVRTSLPVRHRLDMDIPLEPEHEYVLVSSSGLEGEATRKVRRG
jgi:hypothetical protein